MRRATKVALLVGGWLLAQEKPPEKLVIYEELIDRFFQIRQWHTGATTRPDTVTYLKVEGEVPSLESFPNLQALYLSAIEELNLPRLIGQIRRSCPKLRILALEDCDIEDPAPLIELPLHGLLLDDNPIADFSPLTKLKGLLFLSLARTPLNSIEWLSALPTLQAIDVSETPLSDLSPLQKLSALRMVVLYRCTAIMDLSPLYALPKLEFLNLSFIQPAAAQKLLQEIHRFPGLRVLQAQGVITDLAVLSGLSRLSLLEELTIGQNPAITDVGFVRTLQKLLYLDIHRCSVRDLSPLAGHPSLVKLSMGKNQVTSLAPLTSCPRLRELYCYENPISDWEKLLEIPSLSYVMMSKKDLPPQQLANLRSQLRRKGVQVDAP